MAAQQQSRSQMAQTTTGLHRILSHPFVYDAFQSLLGGESARRLIAAQYVRARDGETVIDIGCGTGNMLASLPEDVHYHGFDLSPHYIEAARRRHGKRRNCQFHCADVATLGEALVPRCDIAIAYGLLHHLDDHEAAKFFRILHPMLPPGGRVVTIDNTLIPGQHPLARELIRRDRGRNVRSPEGYLALVPELYAGKEVAIRHDLLRVPYTLLIMTCSK